MSKDVPVGIGRSFNPHHLVEPAVLLPFLQLLLIVLHNFPAFILPLQHLDPLPLQLRLPALLLFLPPHPFIRGEILLESFEGCIGDVLPSIWWVGAFSAWRRVAAPVPSEWEMRYCACEWPAVSIRPLFYRINRSSIILLQTGKRRCSIEGKVSIVFLS